MAAPTDLLSHTDVPDFFFSP